MQPVGGKQVIFEAVTVQENEKYLKQIRECILTAGNNGWLSISRGFDSQIEIIDITNHNPLRLYNSFLKVYNAMAKDWKSENKLSAFEKEVLLLKKDDQGPIQYFRRVADQIIKHPVSFTEKALHDFCILYLSFCDVTIHSPEGFCQIF